MEKKKFVNAVEMNKLYPVSFQIPGEKELDDVEPGDFIKIGIEADESNPGERFWVRVISVNVDKSFSGVIDNDLVLSHHHGWYCYDEVLVQRFEVYATMSQNQLPF